MQQGQPLYQPTHNLISTQKGFLRLFCRQIGTFVGVGILIVVVMSTMALVSWNISDPSLNVANNNEVTNLLGFFGAVFADMAMQLFGLGAVVGLLAPFLWSVVLLGRRSLFGSAKQFFVRILFWPISLFLFSAALANLPRPNTWPLASGLGGMFGDKFLALFSPLFLLVPTQILSLILLTIMTVFGIWGALYAGGVILIRVGGREREKKHVGSAGKLENEPEAISEQSADRDVSQNGLMVLIGFALHFGMWVAGIVRRLLRFRDEAAKETARGGRLSNQGQKNQAKFVRHEPNFGGETGKTIVKDQSQNSHLKQRRQLSNQLEQLNSQGELQFELPYLDFLSPPKIQAHDETLSREALLANSQRLAHILEDFGVKGTIINVRPGPVVTLYEFEPAPGIKSSRIIGLADDIARSMSAVSARIAVISGRNAIGIELPNQRRQTVYLREIFESQTFVSTHAKLALALGKTIGGEAVIADIAKMPHVLVAGTTGSGKSVAINTMIMSLVYRLSPQQCRLIMVDPKMLELSIYDGIPHLLTPVVTDPKKAIIALKWAVREMENRYRKMAKIGVRNIDGFNQRLMQATQKAETLSRTVQTGFDKQTGEPVFETEVFDYQPLPYIVVIIDEMADLMLVAGKEIEAAVQRLAQMARAAGIHVIMATQRPSVDVITGTIKANFPTRISFAVTSKIDSRTILGEQGAEQLLGQGDMLFMMGGGRMARVHGPFIGDEEVERIVAHLKLQGTPDYLDAVMEETEEEGITSSAQHVDSNDPYAQAVAVVLRDGKASTSYIQRRLGIGYNRAASLIERMENEGLISPPNHAGKREILVEAPVEDEVL